MNKWLRTGVFTGALLCALVVAAFPVYAQGNDAGDAEVLIEGVPDTGNTSANTTWWSTDPCVPDRTAPVITLAGDNPVLLFNGENYVEAGFEAVTDLCDGDMLDAMPNMVALEFLFAASVYETVLMYGTDGNEMVAGIEEIFNINGDNPAVPNPFNVMGGEHTIRYIVADSAGNEAVAERVVQVVDQAVIFLNGSSTITGECGVAITDPGATAYEADGTSLPVVVDLGGLNLDVPAVGEYILTYSATSAVDGVVEVMRTVTVVDTAAPEIGVPDSELVVNCGDAFAAPTHWAFDTCVGPILEGDVIVDASDVNPDVTGTYVINYSVTDASGNEGVASRTVVVQDVADPVVTLAGDPMLNYGCDDLYVEAGIGSIVDVCEGDMNLANVMVSAYLYSSLLATATIYDFEDWFNDNYIGVGGDFTFSYSVTDTSGNEGLAERLLSIGCPSDLEMRVAVNMEANFSTDDVTKGDGVLDASELEALFVRLEALFPNLTRVRFDSIISAIRALDVNGDVTLAAIQAYIGSITPTLSIELIGEDTLSLECGAEFVDPGAAVYWGRKHVATVYTTDVVDITAVGSTTVTYRYAGFDQAEVTVDRTVNVADTAAPVIAGPLPERDVECGSVFTVPTALAFDTCEGPLVGAVVVGGETVDTSVPGAVFVITYDAEDSVGNAAEQLVLTVTIVDSTAPVVTIDGADTLLTACGVAITLPTASAADACDGALAASISDADGLNALDPAVGEYEVVYSASDAQDNEGTAILTVTVEDTTAPVVSIEGGNAMSAECGVEFVFPEGTAADDCDDAVNVEITDLGGLDDKNPLVGVYTIVYTATDDEGNVGTADLVLTVDDTVAPVVTIDGGATLTAECGVAVVLPGASALDACAGVLTAEAQDLGGLEVTAPVKGEYLVTYRATDLEGNQGEAILTVTVADTAAPVVTIDGGDTLSAECEVAIVLPGATADDDCDGVVAADLFSQGGLDVDNPAAGAYDVVYQATDLEGNVGSATLVVTVADTVGPVVTIDGGNTLLAECNVAITLPDASALDACDGLAYSAAATDLGGLNLADPESGQYTVTYVSDADLQGNVGQAELIVTVADSGLPVVTIEGPAAITVECGQPVVLPNASAEDDCDGTLVAAASDLAGLDLTTPEVGSYDVVYSATDGADNEGTSILTVTVEDTIVPVITVLSANPLTVECGTLYTPPAYSALDTCEGDISSSVVVDGTVDANLVGSYQVTYDITDSSSNVADTVTLVVNVEDTTDPVLEISQSIGLTTRDVMGYVVFEVPCNSDWDVIEEPTIVVSDSCATLGWLDVIVTATPLNPADFSDAGAPIMDKSFTETPGYYRLDYAVSDGATNTTVVAPGRYVEVDTSCILVPDVYSLTEAAAILAIEALGLVADVEQAYSAAVSIGSVFSQNPAAASLVAPGTTVVIDVARNVVPDLFGMTEAEAAAALLAVNLQQDLGGTVRALDATNTGVYAQDEAAGTVLLPLENVALSVYVPNVIGMTEVEATAAIEAADYTVNASYFWNDTVAAGDVIDQPNAGNGVSVPIVVSFGKQPSAIFAIPPSPMTTDCVDGQVWTDIDPLAEVQSGDGTVLVPDLAASILEYDSDGLGTWVSVDPDNDPLISGDYRATYEYAYNLPGNPPTSLPDVQRLITVSDINGPTLVEVTGDNPANFGVLPGPFGDGYMYHIASGGYSTWAALAAAVGTVPAIGMLGQATDNCEGTFDSATDPDQFTVYVQYYDGMTLADYGADPYYALDDTWLATAPNGYYVIIYVATDNSGNNTAETSFRVVAVGV